MRLKKRLVGALSSICRAPLVILLPSGLHALCSLLLLELRFRATQQNRLFPLLLFAVSSFLLVLRFLFVSRPGLGIRLPFPVLCVVPPHRPSLETQLPHQYRLSLLLCPIPVRLSLPSGDMPVGS